MFTLYKRGHSKCFSVWDGMDMLAQCNTNVKNLPKS